MQDVSDTYKEMTNYGSNAFVKRAGLHQKVFLLALSQSIKRAGVPEVDVGDVRPLFSFSSLGSHLSVSTGHSMAPRLFTPNRYRTHPFPIAALHRRR